MISVKDILKSMYDAVDGVCDRTFISERPEAVDKRIGSFVVCWIPGGLVNAEIGGDYAYRMATATAQFDVYVRDKSSAGNNVQADITIMDDKVNEIIGKLPISDSVVKVTRPNIWLQASDGKGFHVTCVRCNLETK